jgi:hypothetical protein
VIQLVDPDHERSVEVVENSAEAGPVGIEIGHVEEAVVCSAENNDEKIKQTLIEYLLK